MPKAMETYHKSLPCIKYRIFFLFGILSIGIMAYRILVGSFSDFKLYHAFMNEPICHYSYIYGNIWHHTTCYISRLHITPLHISFHKLILIERIKRIISQIFSQNYIMQPFSFRMGTAYHVQIDYFFLLTKHHLLHILSSLPLRIAIITGNDATFSELKGCGLQIMQ